MSDSRGTSGSAIGGIELTQPGRRDYLDTALTFSAGIGLPNS